MGWDAKGEWIKRIDLKASIAEVEAANEAKRREIEKLRRELREERASLAAEGLVEEAEELLRRAAEDDGEDEDPAA